MLSILSCTWFQDPVLLIIADYNYYGHILGYLQKDEQVNFESVSEQVNYQEESWRANTTTPLKSNPLELYVEIFLFLSFIINFLIFLEIVFQNLNPLSITLYVPIVFCTHGFLVSSTNQWVLGTSRILLLWILADLPSLLCLMLQISDFFLYFILPRNGCLGQTILASSNCNVSTYWKGSLQ